MTAVAVSVRMGGLEEIVHAVAGLEERLAHPEPALHVTANLLELHVAAQFATGGGRGSTPWAPLARRTVRARAGRWGYYKQAPTQGAGPTRPILVWTGRLRGSFLRGGEGHIRMVSSSRLIWGSSIGHGRFHRGGSRLPRRWPLDFRNQFMQREIAFQPFRLWVQGVPAGAIETTMQARLGLGIMGRSLRV